MDNVVMTWLVVTVKEQVVAQEGLGLNVGICLGLFYDDYVMVSAQDSEWLQNALNVIVDLFWRYGLVKNIAKSQTMTCQPGAIWLGMS